MIRPLVKYWRWMRTLVGDDAYERYCDHHRTHLAVMHPGQPLLDRREFYLQRQQEKWSGINRCC